MNKAKRNEELIREWAEKTRSGPHDTTGNDRVDSCIGAVYRCAQKAVTSKRARLDQYDDIAQEGFMALLRASELYDPDNKAGTNFSTYAHTAIWNRINRFLQTDRTIRGTINPPSANRQGGAMPLEVVSVDAFAEKLMNNTGSGGDRTDVAWALLCGVREPTHETAVDDQDTFQALSRALLSWVGGDHRTAEIVARRLALDPQGAQEETFESIAESMGLTKQRIDQIYSEAIRAIRLAVLPKHSKACTRCGEVKTLNQFARDGRNFSGLGPWCKPCKTEHGRKWHESNRDRSRAYARRFYETRGVRSRA